MKAYSVPTRRFLTSDGELGGSGEAGELAARTGVSDSEASTVTGQSLLQAAFLPRPSGSFPRARAERSPSTPQRERVAGPGPRGGPARGGVGRLPAADPELLPPARRPRPAPSAAAPGGSGPATPPPARPHPGSAPRPAAPRATVGGARSLRLEPSSARERAPQPASRPPVRARRAVRVLVGFSGLLQHADYSPWLRSHPPASLSHRQVYMPSIRPEQSRRGGAGS
ncbi:uncharacterized protein LOC141577580 [Camelus bactrianus]|uniref:Uncharacterized protein LOC141577580 n=1 Tax=Camelus bactrianus TaxID=9837 RepID=A0AC58QAI6_CAMBA